MAWWLLVVPVAYLVGTFPSAELVARASGVDIRNAGSGNPGASNVSRTLGWRKGIVVFGLDALKGATMAALGLWLGGRAGGHVLGIAAVCGHVFPVLRGVRGGKGVASAGGLTLVLHPLVGVVAGLTWLAVTKLSGKAVLGSLAAVAAVVAGVAITADAAWEPLAMAGLAALLIARHVPNLRRLARGEEHSMQTASR